MSKPNQLYLLADHIKLSLLERQRAQSLNLASDSQDGHISRSLEQFRDGLAALKGEQTRLQAAGDGSAAAVSDSLSSLQKQLDDLTAQFHGFSSPSAQSTLTQPNDPSLAEDFAHASSTAPQSPVKKSLRTSAAAVASPKTVRFSDGPLPSSGGADPDLEAQLFGRYRDDPSEFAYRDGAAGMTNEQIHTYHSSILAEQDDQLDRLSETIGRQRELSMRIGDELDEQVEMLDDTEALVDRHQGRLDRARKQLGKIAKSAGESKQVVAIIVLIVILVLLIAAK